MASGPHTFFNGGIFTAERFQGDRVAVVGVRANLLTDDRKLQYARDLACATAFIHDALPGQPRQIDMYDPARGSVQFGGSQLLAAGLYIFTALERKLEPTEEDAYRVTKLLTKSLGEIELHFNESRLVTHIMVPHKYFRMLSDHLISTSQILDFQPQLQRCKEFVELPPFFSIAAMFPGMESPLIDLTAAPNLLDVVSVQHIPPSSAKVVRPTTCIFYVHNSTENDDDGLVYHDYSIRGIGTDRVEELASSVGACTLAVTLALEKGGASAHHVFNFQQRVETQGRKSQICVEVELDQTGKVVNLVNLSGRGMLYYKGEFSTMY